MILLGKFFAHIKVKFINFIKLSMRASLLHMRTVTSIPRMLHYTCKQRCKQTWIFCEIPIAEQPFLVVIDKLIVFNDQDHKKIDRGNTCFSRCSAFRNCSGLGHLPVIKMVHFENIEEQNNFFIVANVFTCIIGFCCRKVWITDKTILIVKNF